MKEEKNAYIITGGEEGKKRLKILAEVLSSTTKSLFEITGPLTGKKILDVGCGGGDVSIMLARMVGNNGSITGLDFDKEIVNLAQEDAINEGVLNVQFQAIDAHDIHYHDEYDIVYSRFLLSHLKRPMQVLENMLNSIKPSGRIIVEDIQFSGHFCYPACKAFDDYLHYFTTSAKNHEHNPEIGPSLYRLFHQAGIKDIKFDHIQPSFNTGPGKWMAYITMDKIKNTVIKQGLADSLTIDKLLQELEEFTKDEHTIISLPRIFRVWGVK